MKKKKLFTPRLPMEAVIKLRTGGGAHSTKRGKKGYARARDKELQRRHGYAIEHTSMLPLSFRDRLL